MSIILKGTEQSAVLEKGTNIYWYTCGPTVYDHSHIGHARTYVTNDILQRILKYLGYNIFTVMNVTNIDDKIIKKSNENGKSFTEVSAEFTEDFFDDMKTLGVMKPDVVTYVSDYVNEIIQFIEKILQNNMGYESNGSVYIDMKKYYESDNKDILFDTLEFTSDIKSQLDEHLLKEKKDSRDFALWKKAKENEPSWESPWGKGRPAWHIECSVMIEDTLKMFTTESTPFTVHTGGEDLIFPHHENEIKQFIAKDGHNPIDIFLHYGRLNIDGKKMGKSEKNYVKLKDVLEFVSPNVIRMLFLMRNWNERIEYSEGSIKYAQSIFDRVDNFIKHIDAVINSKNYSTKLSRADKQHIVTIGMHKHNFDLTLKDNLNISAAFNVLLAVISHGIEYEKTGNNVDVLVMYKNFVLNSLNMFGFNFIESENNDTKIITNALVKIRDDIRAIGKEKDFNKGKLFTLTDEIRDVIAPSLGFTIEDKGKEPSIWYSN